MANITKNVMDNEYIKCIGRNHCSSTINKSHSTSMYSWSGNTMFQQGKSFRICTVFMGAMICN